MNRFEQSFQHVRGVRYAKRAYSPTLGNSQDTFDVHHISIEMTDGQTVDLTLFAEQPIEFTNFPLPSSNPHEVDGSASAGVAAPSVGSILRPAEGGPLREAL